ncbi:MAG: DUF835 domain-containing protein [Methanomassiliicoccales archaeon]|nr:DUF835 domain-containing protein [Methanomassiliicoccales archaeon]
MGPIIEEAVRIKKILIVDDNPAVLEVVSELVSSAGYQPITATGGKECLAKVESEKPDLILLDITMPDLDGWTVLRELKQRGITDQTKVIMLTAAADVSTDIFGLQDVVTGYIRKPFNNKELADRLKAVFEETPEVLIQEAAKESKKKVGFFGKLRGARQIPSGMEQPTSSAMRYELKKGFSYLVKEKKPKKSFEIFVDQVRHNIQGLCISRQHPEIIRKTWGLEKTPIIWLSNQVGKVYINPTNISILSDTIIRFIEKSGESIVLIDGIEFLVISNDFNKALRMIHHVTEAVMEYKSRLLISIDPRAFDARELALLERNMEIIDAMEE